MQENVGAPPLNANEDLSTFLRTLANELGFYNGHNLRHYVWTWPHGREAEEELWCQAGTDYRLRENSPAFNLVYNPLLAAATAANMTLEQFRLDPGNAGNPAVVAYNLHLAAAPPLNARTHLIPAFPDTRFPNFQVGDMAIRHWWRYAQEYAEHYVGDPPGLTAQAPIGAAAPLAGVAVKDYHENVWAFGRTLRHRAPHEPNLGHERAEVMAFLYQIHSRLVYDQSNAPIIHNETAQFDRIADIPLYPYRAVRARMPCFQGRPGGMFYGQVDRIGPPQGGPRASHPNNWWPQGPGGPAWPHGPWWPGGHPDAPGAPGWPVPPGGGGGGGGWGGGGRGRGYPPLGDENVELVIIRPNIEHNMLGIIMGQGGENLGNTLWGQTELSCYDDSMHGIWGMSYKYHERAIVFNEKNLVRLWDVAYDGYCGGKDSTHVKWTEPGQVEDFHTKTNDVTKTYNGPSMMVMAFVHDRNHNDYRDHFKRNWPSPIVFHDGYDYNPAQYMAQQVPPLNGDYTLTADPNNVHVLNFKDMRVFNNPLYSAYQHYYKLMPKFTALHAVRKPAGASTVENETCCDSLAFQGTMNVVEDGRVVEQILGSGHHGPDYIGVASIRAGKGYKIGAQPTLSRLV